MGRTAKTLAPCLIAIAVFYGLFIAAFAPGYSFKGTILSLTVVTFIGYAIYKFAHFTPVSFGRIQIRNAIAVIFACLYGNLPFVKSHLINSADGNFTIVGWGPFILMFIATAIYYAWMSISNERLTYAFIDHVFFYAVFAVMLECICILLSQHTKWAILSNNSWNTFQNIEIQTIQLFSIVIGSLAGEWVTAHKLKKGI